MRDAAARAPYVGSPPGPDADLTPPTVGYCSSSGRSSSTSPVYGLYHTSFIGSRAISRDAGTSALPRVRGSIHGSWRLWSIVSSLHVIPAVGAPFFSTLEGVGSVVFRSGTSALPRVRGSIHGSWRLWSIVSSLHVIHAVGAPFFSTLEGVGSVVICCIALFAPREPRARPPISFLSLSRSSLSIAFSMSFATITLGCFAAQMSGIVPLDLG